MDQQTLLGEITGFVHVIFRWDSTSCISLQTPPYVKADHAMDNSNPAALYASSSAGSASNWPSSVIPFCFIPDPAESAAVCAVAF